MFQHTRQLIVVSLTLMLSGSMASPARREAKQDSIELVGTVDIHGRNIQDIRLTEHQGRILLYLENTYERAATVVDVTDAAHPTIAREIVLPRGLASVEVLARRCSPSGVNSKSDLCTTAEQSAGAERFQISLRDWFMSE